MIKKISLLITYICTATIVLAQGIDWTDDLSWEQIKDKARKENKYVFIDAYATWCGPCKAMDKEVYPNDTIGNYMNRQFISVKVQMDKTAKDDNKVKNWYGDAAALQKKYRIFAFPSYIFLNPQGEIVHLATGYQPVKMFLETIGEAVKPGKKYDDPYALYEQLAAAYNQGQRNFSEVPYMVRMARQAGDSDFAQQLTKEYAAYLLGEGSSELYKKESIEFFVNSFSMISSNTRLFKVFYEHGDRVDKSVGKSGYAKKVVNNTIKYEIINPYLGPYTGNLMSLKTPDSLQDPDWKKMYAEIKGKYTRAIARRNVLAAKVIFYHKTAQYDKWAPLFFRQIEKYGLDTIEFSGFTALNTAGWVIFQKLDNKQYLKKACRFMEVVVQRVYNNSAAFVASAYIDTYANLLYKAGNTRAAIDWETKAVAIVGERSPGTSKKYLSIIEKMKKGEPTWTGRLF